MAKKRKAQRGIRMTRPTMMLWLVIMVVFFAEAGFHTWCRVRCTQEGVLIDQAQRRQQALLQLQTKLKVELARLKSPARITTIARTRLGLGMPTPGQVIVLR